MSTRDNMRRELKELAKLAETMGKESPVDAAAAGRDVDFPMAGLERPPTPASSSRVSVPPFATPTAPPVFDIPEPQQRSGKRTGFIAVVVGASLAAALVGGAFVGKSLAGGTTTPAVAPITAAAAIAPPPVVAPPAAAPQPPAAPDPAAAPPVNAGVAAVAPTSVTKTAAPAPAAAAPIHKHWAKPATPATKPVVAAAAAAPASAGDAVAAPKAAAPAAAAAAPGLAKPKPAPASAGGSSDSLEDLIRKEVAAQKK